MPSQRPAAIRLLIAHFEPLEDPRVQRTRLHPLENILVMAITAAICGADSFEHVALFAEGNAEWFAEFLDLTHGTPSADTFLRVFSALDREAFAACFGAWVDSLAQSLRGEVVAIDGKALQRALGKARGAKPLHLLHVWATRQQLLLGQKAVPGAPGEPVAIPGVLELLDLRGALVTTDANGCTTAVTRAVRDGEADYALTLKGNRGPQHAFAKRQFAAAAQGGFEGLPSYQEEDKAHGRLEVRRAVALPAAGMPGEANWADVASITLVERERQQVGKRKKSVERVYILSSLKPAEVERIAKAARAHWGVENGLHWSLDVSFREDSHAIRDLNAAENLALVNRMALMMLKREQSRKRVSIAGKRKLAGWKRDYLLTVLSAGIADI